MVLTLAVLLVASLHKTCCKTCPESLLPVAQTAERRSLDNELTSPITNRQADKRFFQYLETDHLHVTLAWFPKAERPWQTSSCELLSSRRHSVEPLASHAKSLELLQTLTTVTRFLTSALPSFFPSLPEKSAIPDNVHRSCFPLFFFLKLFLSYYHKRRNTQTYASVKTPPCRHIGPFTGINSLLMILVLHMQMTLFFPKYGLQTIPVLL